MLRNQLDQQTDGQTATTKKAQPRPLHWVKTGATLLLAAVAQWQQHTTATSDFRQHCLSPLEHHPSMGAAAAAPAALAAAFLLLLLLLFASFASRSFFFFFFAFLSATAAAASAAVSAPSSMSMSIIFAACSALRISSTWDLVSLLVMRMPCVCVHKLQQQADAAAAASLLWVNRERTV
jgi:hypothetical protein